MYPRTFQYHRARSLPDAVSLLMELGGDARLLAGGQSLIPLMKLRLSAPSHLVDLSFVREATYIHANGELRLGAMTRHAEIAASDDVATIPILHDCAQGIADPQVRNMGTIGGSIAEADPTGDWAPVLMAVGAVVEILGPGGERSVDIADFTQDAFTTALQQGELVREIVVPRQPSRSGGAYLALKRCAPVYASASVAVQLTMHDDAVCNDARVYVGVLGLTPSRVQAAEGALRGQQVTASKMEDVRAAIMDVAQPVSDMRGSAEYKRQAAGALGKLACAAALRRVRGETVEIEHVYA
jgi:carbon-monoxide dehydrogenase medium subunit